MPADGDGQAAQSAGSEGFLRFIDVKKSYDRKSLVVKGFHLNVAKGEFITLLGPSGSSKTTVLMLLAGFPLLRFAHFLRDVDPKPG